MDYENYLGLIDHRHTIFDTLLQRETRPSDFAFTTNLWVEDHQVPLIVSPAQPDLLRPIPVRVVDHAEEARRIVSLRWDDDDDSFTVSSLIVASISEQEMDALRAEGARNPFVEEEDEEEEEEDEWISVNTEVCLRVNSGSLFIKPVALRPTDLIAL